MKGMGTNEMFIFAASLVILALVLYMGVKFVGVFNNRSCQIDITSSVNSINAFVHEASVNVGSEKQMKVAVPCDTTLVCFAQSDIPDREPIVDYLRSRSAIAADSYDDAVDNAFFLEKGKIVHAWNIGGLDVRGDTVDGVICVGKDDAVFRVKGIGKKAELSRWV